MTKKKKWTVDDIADLTGKIVVITGANSGTGFEATKILAKKGAHVIMGCRNEEKGKKALEEIKKELPESSIEYMHLDLSNLKSINEFTTNIKSKYKHVDVLLNNAGVMQTPHKKTEDGFELQIGINHLGHFALTGLLLDLIKATPEARVVTMSSTVHTMGKVDTTDLQFENGRKYDRTKSYSQSKLANLLFAYELDRKFKENNITAISVASHPGYAATNLQSSGLSLDTGLKAKFYRWTYKITNKVIAQSAYMGSLPMVMAGVDNSVKGGEYYGPTGLLGQRGYPGKTKSNEKSHDVENAQKLWKISEELTKVHYSF
ncbi:MAG: oxidoreductase [Candidatus Thorarchaeota archaeon]